MRSLSLTLCVIMVIIHFLQNSIIKNKVFQRRQTYANLTNQANNDNVVLPGNIKVTDIDNILYEIITKLKLSTEFNNLSNFYIIIGKIGIQHTKSMGLCYAMHLHMY